MPETSGIPTWVATRQSGLRPIRKQSAHSVWAVTTSHLFAKASVAEHLRNLRKHQQMMLGRMLGGKKYHQVRHRFRVGCIEGYGQLEPYKSRHRLRQVLDACVRKRDSQT